MGIGDNRGSRIPLHRVSTIAPEQGWGGHFHIFDHPDLDLVPLFAGMRESSF